MIQFDFQFTDGVSHDASVSEASISQEVCFNHFWLLVPRSSGLDANPVYTIEVSDDDVLWNPYSSSTIDAAIDQGFDDDHLTARYIRVNYDADTNTTGDVEFKITLKK